MYDYSCTLSWFSFFYPLIMDYIQILSRNLKIKRKVLIVIAYTYFCVVDTTCAVNVNKRVYNIQFNLYSHFQHIILL